MKEVMNYKDFCKENGLSEISQQSQSKYKLYIAENRPHTDEMRKKAQEVLSESSKKK